MVDVKRLVPVRNRNNGSTSYTLKEDGIFRLWNRPGEVKNISIEELKKANYIPGASYILKNLLIIEDAEALSYLDMEVEPEYSYTDEDIKNILLSNESDALDRLEDFLNFSPEGGIEILKQLAVELEIPDTRKRKMISEKTGFNIDNAIYVNKVMADDEPAEEKKVAKRKAAPLGEETKSSTPARKAVPKYNVTSISE